MTNRLIILHLQLSVDHIDDLLDAVPAIEEAEVLCFQIEKGNAKDDQELGSFSTYKQNGPTRRC